MTQAELKEKFVEELQKKQYFCSGFSHRFIQNPAEAIDFWIYCGLHYPYQAKHFAAGYVRIIFDRVYATSILQELTQDKREQLSNRDAAHQELQSRFIRQLKTDKFCCDRFSHPFATTEEAISFWAKCGLGYPYSIDPCAEGKEVQITFQKEFGVLILAILEAAKVEEPKKVPNIFPFNLAALKQTLLDQLQAFERQCKGQCFVFSTKFDSMADAELFGHYCCVLGPMCISFDNGGCYLECLESVVDEVIKILKPEPTEAAPKLMPKMADLTIEKLCELKDQLLQELKAHKWEDDLHDYFTFSPTFVNSYDARFFADFCDIRPDVSFVTHETARTTQIRCAKTELDIITAKCQLKNDVMTLDTAQALKVNLMHQLRVYNQMPLHAATFQFSWGFARLSWAMSFAEVVGIRHDVDFVKTLSNVFKICCNHNVSNTLLEKLTNVPELPVINTDDHPSSQNKVSDVTPQPPQKKQKSIDFESIEYAIGSAYFRRLKRELLKELLDFDWEKRDWFHFHHKFATHEQAVHFVKSDCDIFEEAKYVHCGDYVTVMIDECRAEQATKKLSVFFGLPPQGLEQFRALKKKLLEDLLAFDWNATLWFEFDQPFESRPQAVTFARFHCGIGEYVGYKDIYDEDGHFETTKLILAKCHNKTIIDKLAEEVEKDRECLEKQADPDQLSCPEKMSDQDWQKLQDWIMSANKEDIVGAFAKLLKKE